jgi:peptide subunit release factor RF-3
VVKFRLESEYGVAAEVTLLPYRAGGWVGAGRAALAAHRSAIATRVLIDHRGRAVVLAEDPFTIRYLKGKEPGLQIRPFSDDLFAPAG